MSSLCSSCRILAPQWRHKSPCFLIFVHSKRNISFTSGVISSSTSEDSVPSPKEMLQLRYDSSEELFGLDVTSKPRDDDSGAPKLRSWFGPNGQYIRELPCPSCRGRGYTPCTECGIDRSRLDCSQCTGKGMMICRQCLGECVIWEESIDERPWEKARSTSPLKVKEDDEVDNLDIKLGMKKKSKRVYQSPPPEVGLKISRSLKSLNAKTGLFSKRMKIIHRDPKLHAQRVAAIKASNYQLPKYPLQIECPNCPQPRKEYCNADKDNLDMWESEFEKAKGTAAARRRASESLKAFFSDPANRHKRSIAMKGVKFYCKNCGREGHRRHYCPELKDSLIGRQFRCRLCGEKGHNRRTCRKSRSSNHGNSITRKHRCRLCSRSGHNRRTCPQVTGVSLSGTHAKRIFRAGSRTCTCQLCQEKGHNIRTCPIRIMNPIVVNPQSEEGKQ